LAGGVIVNWPVWASGEWQPVQSVSPGAPVRPVGGPPLDASVICNGCESNIVNVIKTMNPAITANLTERKLIFFIFLSSNSVTGGNRALIKTPKLLAKVV